MRMCSSGYDVVLFSQFFDGKFNEKIDEILNEKFDGILHELTKPFFLLFIFSSGPKHGFTSKNQEVIFFNINYDYLN